MQHTDHHQAALSARGGFRKLLEEVDIVAGAQGGGFQEFPHLVDDDQHAVMWAALSLFEKLGDQRLGIGLAATVDAPTLRASE